MQEAEFQRPIFTRWMVLSHQSLPYSHSQPTDKRMSWDIHLTPNQFEARNRILLIPNLSPSTLNGKPASQCVQGSMLLLRKLLLRTQLVHILLRHGTLRQY